MENKLQSELFNMAPPDGSTSLFMVYSLAYAWHHRYVCLATIDTVFRWSSAWILRCSVIRWSFDWYLEGNWCLLSMWEICCR